MSRTSRYLLLYASIALLGACSSQPINVPGSDDWLAHSQRISALQQWRAEGKIALRSSRRSDSANLSWRQQNRQLQLDLSGPLGFEATRITGDEHTLLVQRGGESHSYDLDNPAAIAAAIEWDIPLQALPFWLRGLPAPMLEAQQQDTREGLLRSLVQQGWRVEYSSYGRFGDYTLPTKLSVSRDGNSAKLILRDWTTEQP